MYNSEVGYCQGMSTLAGMLLMYLGEEETFWALNILLADKKVTEVDEWCFKIKASVIFVEISSKISE